MKSTEVQVVQDKDSRIISMSFGDISGGGGEEVSGIVRIYRSQDTGEFIGAVVMLDYQDPIELKDWDPVELKEEVARYFEEHVSPGQPVDAFDIFKRFKVDIWLAEDVLRELEEEGCISGMETTSDKEATEGDGRAS